MVIGNDDKVSMGCQFSAEKDVRPSPLPLETRKPVEGAVEHGTNTASNDFEKKSVLNPSVTLKQMLLRPKLTSLTEVVSGEAHHIKNIFAKPLDALHFQNFKAPVYPKTEEEKEFIMEALKKNFVFESLAHQGTFLFCFVLFCFLKNSSTQYSMVLILGAVRFRLTRVFFLFN